MANTVTIGTENIFLVFKDYLRKLYNILQKLQIT